MDDVELKENGSLACIMIDFAHRTSLPIERTTRFNAKKLKEHADNWFKIQRVKELIAEICKARGFELTVEGKKIAGIVDEIPATI